MLSLPAKYRALVVGASGAIGSAFAGQLRSDPRCDTVLELCRDSVPRIDYDDEGSIAHAAGTLRAAGPFHLVVVSTGVLHGAGFAPEKRLADVTYASLETVFRINAFGPALVMRHFCPLLDRERSILAVVSAKVGSIEDNRLGGWYAYRASKAALNMTLKTAAIELRRANSGAVLVALHPGTVKSALSRPFRGDEIGRDASQAAADMLGALDGVRPEDSGSFVSYDGTRLPW